MRDALLLTVTWTTGGEGSEFAGTYGESRSLSETAKEFNPLLGLSRATRSNKYTMARASSLVLAIASH